MNSGTFKYELNTCSYDKTLFVNNDQALFQASDQKKYT